MCYSDLYCIQINIMCKSKDLSKHDSHSVTKDVGEINRSSGLHVFELHTPSAGGGMLILVVIAAAVYVIYTLCTHGRRRRPCCQDSREFQRGIFCANYSILKYTFKFFTVCFQIFKFTR